MSRNPTQNGWSTSLAWACVVSLGCTGVVSRPLGPDGRQCSDVGEIDPSATPLLRLTRVEYDNLLRDALGITDHPAAGFAPDELAGSLTINAVNPVGLTQVRDYMDTADRIAVEVAPRYADLGDCAASDGLACVRAFIERVGRRLYRRPLSADETESYLAIYSAFAEPTAEDGISLVLSAMLQSPHFLYHVELDDPLAPALAGSVVQLPAYAFAARLSFFLWKSGPDDALLDAARDGALDDPGALSATVEAMLEDPRSRGTLDAFHTQWLGLGRLDGATRDGELYPGFDAATRDAMIAETLDFVSYVYRSPDDASFTALMTAPFSFPRGAVLAIEGVTDPDADPSEPIALDPTQRAGLLTQPSFLTAHAHVSQSSPVLRGRAIRERIFCQPLSDPPPNVEVMIPELDPSLTTRERYAEHRSNPSCASCHQMIDDLGFALENYDAIGAYRDLENGQPIDAAGVIIETDVDGRIGGAIELAERIASSQQARECLTSEWFRFALARAPSPAERCFVADVAQHLGDRDGLRAMLVAIALSRSMSHHVVPDPDLTPLVDGVGP